MITRVLSNYHGRNAYMKKYYRDRMKRDPAWIALQRQRGRERRVRYREHDTEVVRRRLRHQRMFVLLAYGGRCECCGEDRYEFLTLEHREDKRHTAQRVGGSRTTSRLVAWLIRNDLPPGICVLCHNCNCAKGFYGACPHQE